jgi:hypothetical protein
MKKKLLFGVVLVMVAALSLGLVGCVAIPDKATGGGFLENECTGAKVTFGFNVQDTGDWCAKGQFQLVDHDDGTCIHGSFDHFTWTLFGGGLAWGVCSVTSSDTNGEYPFYIYVDDNGEPGVDDYIKVTVVIPGPDIKYKGTIDGGNIQLHYPKY